MDQNASNIASSPQERGRVPVICLALAVLNFIVFSQTLTHGFILLDDDVYVYANPIVTQGLTWKGIAWVFTHADCNLYHPLTMLSLMADYQLHGLHTGGYHLTNVALHAASAVLLFLVLRQMTGAMWRSAMVAAVFAIHPLRVESVAWVAERKDVLGAFFFMLTLAAYARYVRAPKSVGRYLVVAAVFVLALLSKPTTVTLPFVLLLLDYWPLRRFAAPRKLILEKIPLLTLALTACALTTLAAGQAVVSYESFSWSSRLGNALVSYAVYLRQMVWPLGLAPYYPRPEQGQPFWAIALASGLLALISGAVLAGARKRPWLLTGWLWYLGMLVPMIGLVQAGAFAHADRMTYLPQIGLYLAVIWLLTEWSVSRTISAGLTFCGLSALIICCWRQTAFWKNDETLWAHTAACTSGNYRAQLDWATALLDEGKPDEAAIHFQKALEIKPDYAEACYDLGLISVGKKQLEDAIKDYQRALEIKPDYAEAHYNLANIFQEQGHLDDAIIHYQKASQLKPDSAKIHLNLGVALLQKGKTNDAATQYQGALQLSPEYEGAHYNLALLLLQEGQTAKAITELKTSVRLVPGHTAAQQQLIDTLLKSGKAAEALPYCQALANAEPGNARAQFNLGWACEQANQPVQALTSYKKAVKLAPNTPPCLNALAWLYATSPQPEIRNGAEAVRLASQACQITQHHDPQMLDTLAAAYAEAGQFDEAVKTTQEILTLAGSAHDTNTAEMEQHRLDLYQSGKPYRDKK